MRAALDQAITGEAQLFDGNAAVPSRPQVLAADRHFAALVDTMQRYKMPGAIDDLISGAEMD